MGLFGLETAGPGYVEMTIMEKSASKCEAVVMGEISMTVVDKFDEKIKNPLLEVKANEIFLNLDRVVFIDSIGFGKLLSLHRTIKALNKVLLIKFNKNVEQVVKDCSLHQIFHTV